MLTSILIFPVLCSLINADSLPAESYDNHLVNTEWQVDGVAFGDKDRQNYSFTPVSDEMFQWGHFISFTGDSFETVYRAQCGNDCFTRVTGKYRYVGEYQIQVTVAEISYSGFCSEKRQSPYTARYVLSFEGDVLNLVKRPER